MIERKMLGKRQPEGEKNLNSTRRERLVNQTEVDKKIKPEEGNTGRRGDLHLLHSESDCSEERFTLPHLPVGSRRRRLPCHHSSGHSGAAHEVSSLPPHSITQPLFSRETLLKRHLPQPLSPPRPHHSHQSVFKTTVGDMSSNSQRASA